MTYTIDTLIGSAMLSNSGDSTEKQALADALGIDIGLLTLDDKLDVAPGSPTLDDAGSWVLDIAPETPGYFLLKFGSVPKNSSATSDTFFFENIGELTALVFTDAQVQGITGSAQCGGSCNIEKLSHYTTFDATVVPLPAALPLLAGGLGLLGFLGRRRRRSV